MNEVKSALSQWIDHITSVRFDDNFTPWGMNYKLDLIRSAVIFFEECSKGIEALYKVLKDKIIVTRNDNPLVEPVQCHISVGSCEEDLTPLDCYKIIKALDFLSTMPPLTKEGE